MLNYQTLLLITKQEELNQLEELIPHMAKDSLHVEGEEYVAFMDDVLCIVPLKEIDEGHRLYGVKPTLFRKWYKKQLRKLDKNK